MRAEDGFDDDGTVTEEPAATPPGDLERGSLILETTRDDGEDAPRYRQELERRAGPTPADSGTGAFDVGALADLPEVGALDAPLDDARRLEVERGQRLACTGGRRTTRDAHEPTTA